MNLFVATGNLGSDCEVRVAGQSTICTFSIAIKSGYGKSEKVSWCRCNLWGKRSEGRLPEFLKKGTQVAVSGEISLNTWQGTDGVEKTSLELNVNDLDLIGGKQDSQPRQQAPQPEESVPF